MKTFYSTISNGPMTGNKSFYDENMTKEEIIADLKARRIELGRQNKFDGTRIIVPYQQEKPKDYTPGHCEDVTEYVKSLLNGNPNYDLWNEDIPCDIMLIRSSLKGVVLAYPVADCPVVIVESRNSFGDSVAMGLAHCGASYIDRHLPENLVDAVKKASKCKDNQLSAYIGPCAGYNDYIYDRWPKWATDTDFWEKFIRQSKDEFKINLLDAVRSQLKNMKVPLITSSGIDTISNPNFYSNSAYSHGAKTKGGRFLTGAYYK